jgi:hypothetical protein
MLRSRFFIFCVIVDAPLDTIFFFQSPEGKGIELNKTDLIILQSFQQKKKICFLPTLKIQALVDEGEPA